MKLPESIEKIVTNQYFLYFVSFITVMNLFGYMTLGNVNAIIMFAIVGFLTYNFSKNMSIVLLVPLIVTNALVSAKIIKEKFDTITDSDSSIASIIQQVKNNESKKNPVILPPDLDTSVNTDMAPSQSDELMKEPFSNELPYSTF